MPSLLDTALGYASLGWYIFPCKPRGKEPITPRGVLDASNDPEVIRQWWTRTPDANIAVAMGVSQLMVVDIDTRNRGDLSWTGFLKPQFPDVPTLTCNTGGGGQHVYYRQVENPPAKFAKTLAKGVDLQAGNKYVIAPPSIHPNGRPYVWATEYIEPAPFPPELAGKQHKDAKIRPPGSKITPPGAEPGTPTIPEDQIGREADSVMSKVYSENALKTACETIKSAQPGKRQYILNREGFGIGQLIGGGYLDEGKTCQALWDAAMTLVNHDPQSGTEAAFTEAEVEATLSHAVGEGMEKPRQLMLGEMKKPGATAGGTPGVPLPVDPEDDPNHPGYNWSDHGLAKRVIKVLEAQFKCRVANAQGDLWRYNEESHVWEPVSDVDRAIFQKWEGFVGGTDDKGKPKVLKYEDRKSSGIARCIFKEILGTQKWFDRPTPGAYFGNGRWWKGELHPHTSEDHNRFCLPLAYDPNADTTVWDGFMEQLLPDPAARDTIHEFVGAALTGIATTYAKALFLIGAGANGKSTLIEVIRELFNPQFVKTIAPHEFAEPYYKGELAKAQLNVVSEVSKRELVSAEAFKAIISGDQVNGRVPYKPVFDFRPRAAHIFAANQLPMIEDRSHGFRRRLMVVPFDVKITKQIPHYHEILIEKGLAGLLRRAIEGSERLVAQGCYTEATRGKDVLDAWMKDTNPVALFVEGCTDPGELYDEKKEVTSAVLYSTYSNWADLNGFRPVASNAFGRQLVELGVERRDSHGKHIYALITRADFMK
jgi:P4 family phage/plasmid primase-like protien